MQKRTCLVCDEVLKGRIDKKFCSANCKSSYQYDKIRNTDQLYYKVDKQLKTNRKILKKYNKVGKTTLRREVLQNEGFNPNYFTHFRKTATGDVYFYCYDFGFLKMEETTSTELKQKYLIVNWNGK